VKVDRASMLNSLEVRAPLLDYRLIEFAFGKVPSRFESDGDSPQDIIEETGRPHTARRVRSRAQRKVFITARIVAAARAVAGFFP